MPRTVPHVNIGKIYIQQQKVQEETPLQNNKLSDKSHKVTVEYTPKAPQ